MPFGSTAHRLFCVAALLRHGGGGRGLSCGTRERPQRRLLGRTPARPGPLSRRRRVARTRKTRWARAATGVTPGEAPAASSSSLAPPCRALAGSCPRLVGMWCRPRRRGRSLQMGGGWGASPSGQRRGGRSGKQHTHENGRTPTKMDSGPARHSRPLSHLAPPAGAATTPRHGEPPHPRERPQPGAGGPWAA